MSHSSPRPSRSGADAQNTASDSAADPSAQNASDQDGGYALAPYRRQMLTVKPEVIIEIPPPVKKGRRFVWLGVGIVPLIITVIALSALAARPQLIFDPAQEATVEAMVESRLAEERANSALPAINAALEATVEARVAIRLAQERAAQARQPATQPLAAVEPTATPTAANALAAAVSDEEDPFFGQAKGVVHLRQGPGEEYDSKGLIPNGARLRLLGRTANSGWYFVRRSASNSDASSTDGTGWVAGWLVTIPPNDNPLRLAVVFPPPPAATQNESQP